MATVTSTRAMMPVGTSHHRAYARLIQSDHTYASAAEGGLSGPEQFWPVHPDAAQAWQVTAHIPLTTYRFHRDLHDDRPGVAQE